MTTSDKSPNVMEATPDTLAVVSSNVKTELGDVCNLDLDHISDKKLVRKIDLCLLPFMVSVPRNISLRCVHYGVQRDHPY